MSLSPLEVGRPGKLSVAELESAQVWQLYVNAPVAMLTGVVNGAILVAVLRHAVAANVLLGWCVALVVTTLARYLLVARYRRSHSDAVAHDRWGVWFMLSMALSGLVWGIGGLVMYVPQAPAQQMFICFVVGGMMAGAAGMLSAQLKAFFAFALPSVLPLSVRLLLEGDELHVIMAAMVILFVGVMSVTAVRNRNANAASIALRFEKDQLLASLEVSKERAESLNAVLERRTQKLERVNRELRSFAYSVSHELRAPLRAIAGYSELLGEECAKRLGAPDREYLRHISDSAVRMARMIDGLLMLSRVTRGSLRREPVNLTMMATRIVDELQEAQPRQQLEVSIQNDLAANCDPELTWQLLENLLSNAVKFTKATSTPIIEVGGLNEAARTVYFVRDNGAGFDMRYARQLFLPFHRLHTDAEFPGEGVGLATAQRIVRRHAGKIWAEGSVGGGATFYFTLEAAPASKKKVELSPGAPK